MMQHNATEVAAKLLLSEDYITIPLPLANLLGLEEAVLLKQIDAWCIFNERRQSQAHYKLGYYWTYGSYAEWLVQMPFLNSARTIQRLILSLEKQQLLISGYLSDLRSDRRKWYRVDHQKLGTLYLTSSQDIVPKMDGGQTGADTTVPKMDGGSAKNGGVVVPEVDGGSARSEPSSIYKDLNQGLNSTTNTNSPPTPPVGEQPGEGDKTPAVEVEVLETELVAHEPATRYKRNQPQYPKNIDGSDRLPWDIPGVVGKFDPKFEKWMAASLIDTTYYKNLPASQLLTKVRKHISVGKYNLEHRDKLLIEWEAMQAHGDSNEVSNPLTAKAALTRAKIARAISSPSTF